MIKRKLSEKASWILAGAAITGMVCTVISSVKAGEKLAKEKEAMDDDTDMVEKSIVYSKVLAKPVGIATATCVCFTVAVTNSEAKAGKFAGTAMLLEQTLRKYQQKIVETYGEEEEAKIRHEINISDIEDCADSMHPTDDLEDLECFYDEMSKRTFTDTLPNVLEAILKLNREFERSRVGIEQNRFYEILGNPDLQPTEEGWYRGWSKWLGDTDYGYYMIDIRVEPMELDDGFVYNCIHPIVMPHSDFDIY